MSLLRPLSIILLATGLSLSLHAKNDQKTTKTKKALVNKLGSRTGKIEAKEIKEGFVFKNGKGKLTLLVLWTKDCQSCLADIPNLNRYFLDFRGKLNIIAIELSGMTTKELQKFAKERKVLYTLISGTENKTFTSRIMEKFGFDKSLPFQIVLGYTGHTNGIIKGVPKDPAEMKKFLLQTMQYYEKQKQKKKPAQPATKK